MVAGEVAAKPKQDFVCLQVENLFSDPVMWHRCIAQAKKKTKKSYVSPLTYQEREAFSRTKCLL